MLTCLRVRLHRLRRLLAGFIVFPWAQAAAVWHGNVPVTAESSP